MPSSSRGYFKGADGVEKQKKGWAEILRLIPLISYILLVDSCFFLYMLWHHHPHVVGEGAFLDNES